jgi:hypothetical protein
MKERSKKMVSLLELQGRVEAIDHQGERRAAAEARKQGLESRLAELRPQLPLAQAAVTAANEKLSLTVKAWRADRYSKPLVDAHHQARSVARGARATRGALLGEISKCESALAGRRPDQSRRALLGDELLAQKKICDALRADRERARGSFDAIHSRAREQSAAWGEGRTPKLPVPSPGELQRIESDFTQANFRLRLAEEQMHEVEAKIKEFGGGEGDELK